MNATDFEIGSGNTELILDQVYLNLLSIRNRDNPLRLVREDGVDA